MREREQLASFTMRGGAIPEEMSNSSKARNHFSEIGVRNRLHRITRKLFFLALRLPLLPPPSPPLPPFGRRCLLSLPSSSKPPFTIPRRTFQRGRGEGEEPSAALLLRPPLDSPQLRSAVNQPFHPSSHRLLLSSQKSRR